MPPPQRSEKLLPRRTRPHGGRTPRSKQGETFHPPPPPAAVFLLRYPPPVAASLAVRHLHHYFVPLLLVMLLLYWPDVCGPSSPRRHRLPTPRRE